MRRLILIVATIICVFLSATVFAQKNRLKFTRTDAKKNCIAYMKALIDAKSPSIAFFDKYYSLHDESEYGEELNHCYRTWGEPFACRENELVLEDNCYKYMKERWEASPKNTQSLYLSRLQKLLRVHKGKFKIAGIKMKEHDDNFIEYIVIGNIGVTKIELRHAASELSWELGGLVKISKINDMDIDSLIPREQYAIIDCNKR